MCAVAERASRTGSKRAARFVGLLAVVGSLLLACGKDDGGPDGGPDGGATVPDAGSAGNAADGSNGNDGSSLADASSSGADAPPGDSASGDGSIAVDAGGGDGAVAADGGADGADGADGAGTQDAAVDAGVDANGETLVIRVNPRNDCSVTTTPPSPIKIAAGQWFHATFINVGEISTDIAKRDAFNVVPLVLGLEPGMTYADTIRPWCQGVSGKFSFEITPCQSSPYELEVDCGP